MTDLEIIQKYMEQAQEQGQQPTFKVTDEAQPFESWLAVVESSGQFQPFVVGWGDSVTTAVGAAAVKANCLLFSF